MASSAAAELVDFAEAPARFMSPAPGLLLRVSERYALAGELVHTWTAVEGIRLQASEVGEAVAEVDAFMHEAGTPRASWWLTERSTPADVEERLLAAGCTRDERDYLHAAMLLTSEPPGVDGIESRPVATLAEFVESRRLQRSVFGYEQGEEDFEREWALQVHPIHAAWIDGRMASAGRVVFTRVGGYLMGGVTAEWARGRGAYRAVVRARWDEAVRRGTPALAVGAGPMSRPILERLGFEQVAQFRRIESVRSDR